MHARRRAGDGLRDAGRQPHVNRFRGVRIERCSLKACTYGLVDVTEASIVVTHPLGEPRTATLLWHNDTFSDGAGGRPSPWGQGLVERTR
jgi:hypothetical protein